MRELSISTPRQGFIDITADIVAVVRDSQVKNGMCQVFVPHTTAGITINENADPTVVGDMLAALDKMVPDLQYRHCEGNSPAHVKASLVGASVVVPIVNNKLYLGTWQGLYFCEFDGPRQRRVMVNIVGQ